MMGCCSRNFFRHVCSPFPDTTDVSSLPPGSFFGLKAGRAPGMQPAGCSPQEHTAKLACLCLYQLTVMELSLRTACPAMPLKGSMSSTHCRLHKAPTDSGPPMSPPPSPPLLGHTAGCWHLLFTPCSCCTSCAKTPPQAYRQLSEPVPRPLPPHHLDSHCCASSASSWIHQAFHF